LQAEVAIPVALCEGTLPAESGDVPILRLLQENISTQFHIFNIKSGR
jgi:hypothetical protein